MSGFQREERYIVIKRKHLLFPETAKEKIAEALERHPNTNPFIECAVVESDWPEYETVWRMIEDRVVGRGTAPPFQNRVGGWMLECFTPEITADKLERNDRFIEEALELVQSCGYEADRAHALVDYVFSRPVGEPSQEVGGVMVTLAALCNPHGIDMIAAAESELARILAPEVIEKIRAKQASKPTGSALPIPVPQPDARVHEYCGDVEDTFPCVSCGARVPAGCKHSTNSLERVAKTIDPDAWDETLPTDDAYWSMRRHKARVIARSALTAVAAAGAGEPSISDATKRMAKTLGAEFVVRKHEADEQATAMTRAGEAG